MGETSLRVELFTEKYGIVSLVIKGARKPKNKPPLNKFHPYLFSWKKSKDLGIVYKWDEDPTTHSILPLNNYLLFYSLCYVNELLLISIRPHDPYPNLFKKYQAILDMKFSKETVNRELLRFEQHLLNQIGYGFNYSNINNGDTYFYDPSYGLRKDNSHSSYSSKDDKLFNLSGSSLNALKKGFYDNLDETTVLKYRKLMRHILLSQSSKKSFKVRDSFVPINF